MIPSTATSLFALFPAASLVPTTGEATAGFADALAGLVPPAATADGAMPPAAIPGAATTLRAFGVTLATSWPIPVAPMRLEQQTLTADDIEAVVPPGMMARAPSTDIMVSAQPLTAIGSPPPIAPLADSVRAPADTTANPATTGTSPRQVDGRRQPATPAPDISVAPSSMPQVARGACMRPVAAPTDIAPVATPLLGADESPAPDAPAPTSAGSISMHAAASIDIAVVVQTPLSNAERASPAMPAPPQEAPRPDAVPTPPAATPDGTANAHRANTAPRLVPTAITPLTTMPIPEPGYPVSIEPARVDAASTPPEAARVPSGTTDASHAMPTGSAVSDAHIDTPSRIAPPALASVAVDAIETAPAHRAPAARNGQDFSPSMIMDDERPPPTPQTDAVGLLAAIPAPLAAAIQHPGDAGHAPVPGPLAARSLDASPVATSQAGAPIPDDRTQSNTHVPRSQPTQSRAPAAGSDAVATTPPTSPVADPAASAQAVAATSPTPSRPRTAKPLPRATEDDAASSPTPSLFDVARAPAIVPPGSPPARPPTTGTPSPAPAGPGTTLSPALRSDPRADMVAERSTPAVPDAPSPLAPPKSVADNIPNPPDPVLRPTDSFTPQPALPAVDRIAAPPPAVAAPPAIPVHSGMLGHDTGVAIARHVLAGGGEALTIRLDPKDFGRVEVNLSFDDAGTLRAVVAADVPASLDLLRRDAPELTRALSDAGLRADAATLRFDTRGDGGGQSGQRQPHPQPSRYPVAAPAEDATPDTPTWRPLATRGRIDLMA